MPYKWRGTILKFELAKKNKKTRLFPSLETSGRVTINKNKSHSLIKFLPQSGRNESNTKDDDTSGSIKLGDSIGKIWYTKLLPRTILLEICFKIRFIRQNVIIIILIQLYVMNSQEADFLNSNSEFELLYRGLIPSPPSPPSPRKERKIFVCLFITLD